MTSPREDEPIASIAALSVDASLGLKLLPTVLSLTAGSVDVIGFLGLGGLFTAHITGNLVILAAHIIAGGEARFASLLSVPVFMLVLILTRLFLGGLESMRVDSLRPLLLLQFALLASFFALCAVAGPFIDLNSASAVLAGMLGVSAMAVQGALVQVSVKGAPPTVVMTTNVARFMLDVGEVLLGGDAEDVAKARHRANHTWPAIVGFAVGVGLGAACEAAFGLLSLALPVAFALLALACSPRRNSQLDTPRLR